MKHWWCMECDAEVGLNKHGQCGICGSEAVDLVFTDNESTRSDSETPQVSDPVSACS
jgi:hypothetical protein